MEHISRYKFSAALLQHATFFIIFREKMSPRICNFGQKTPRRGNAPPPHGDNNPGIFYICISEVYFVRNCTLYVLFAFLR
jgi:hypothetical protein